MWDSPLGGLFDVIRSGRARSVQLNRDRKMAPAGAIFSTLPKEKKILVSWEGVNGPVGGFCHGVAAWTPGQRTAKELGPWLAAFWVR
ncbi:MAG TPA: hypothetical protein VFB34_05280 [Chloroflexota bacterium]|nr:hypothetical protein [Chloroflexota bacterium]